MAKTASSPRLDFALARDTARLTGKDACCDLQHLTRLG